MKRIAAIIVAAGNSSRLPGEVPKVYRRFNGKTVLEHSVELFQQHPLISQVVIVANTEHEPHYRDMKEAQQLWFVKGGQTRQQSVYNGLDALADNPPDWVLVHDAARPHVSAGLIDRVLDALEDAPAAIPSIPVKDTIKRGQDGYVSDTLPRDALHAVQTPQGFHYPELLATHIALSEQSFTDDAALMEAAGLPVTLVVGDESNAKLTTPEDLARMFPARETRLGQGFDVHRLIEDAARPLMLCGVEVPSDLALEAHSDGDVGLHALVDALLGAQGAGDIGEHFPPSDPKWKDCNSQDFITEAMRLLKSQGGHVVNADITIIAEVPKLSPFKTEMKERVAQLLEIAPSRVNIKATTTEGLGFTGRKEGIAAQAVVSVLL